MTFLLFSQNTFCQCESEWIQTIGGLPTGSQASVGFDLEVAQDGSVYVISSEYRSDSILIDGLWIDGAGSANVQNRDFYVCKYSSTGNIEWIVYGGGDAQDYVKDAALDSEGNIYLTGQFQGVLEFNVGGQVLSTGVQDIFLCKITSTGSLEWVRNYGNSTARGMAVDVDDEGIYMAGAFFNDSIVVGDSTFFCSPPVGQSDVIVVKHDFNGNPLWAKHIFGENSQQVSALSVSNGQIALAGVFLDELITSEQTIIGSESYQYYLCGMTTTQGLVNWILPSTGGGLSAIVEDILHDQDNNIFLSGRFNTDTLSFENVQTVNNGAYDYFILRASGEGDPEWVISSDGSGFEVISGMTLSGNELIVTGGFTQTSFSVGGFNLTNLGETDVFIAAYNADNGFGICGLSYHGEGVEQGLSVQTIGQNLYVEGLFTEVITLGENQITPIGNQDLFVWKTCIPCDTLTGIEDSETDEPSFSLAPNPATSIVRVGVTGMQPVGVTFTDMLGREVHRSSLTARTSDLSLSGFAKGIYAVTVITENEQRITQKLVVE